MCDFSRSLIGLSLVLHACIHVCLSSVGQRNLLRDLFERNEYNKNAIPKNDSSDAPLEVAVELSIFSLENLDEKDQIMMMTLWMTRRWKDIYLQWDPAEYNNTPYIVVEATDIWLPDLVIRNSAESVYGDIMADEMFRTIVTNEGLVNYWTAGKTKTSCLVDITYFPFDEQVCELETESWTYAGDMMLLKNVSNNINFGNYRSNGQWDIYKNVTKYYLDDYGGIKFSRYVFEFYLRRKPLYMVMTIVLPSVILAFLVILVFYLPADAGEKLSLGVTLLLSFSVFQLLLADSLPRSSDYTPVLSIYIMCAMGMSAMSLLLSLVVLNIHHKDGVRPLPKKLKKMFGALGSCMGLGNKHNDLGRKDASKVSPIDDKQVIQSVISLSEGGDADKKLGKGPILTEGGYNELISRVNVLVNKIKQDEEEETKRQEWIMAAKLLDRLFMYIFLVVTVLLTIILLGIFPATRPEKNGPIET